MATTQPANNNKRWTPADQAELRRLADGNTPTKLIAYKMRRTEAAIYSEAARLGVSLMPANRPPYNRRKR
jgi:hypothetical protein